MFDTETQNWVFWPPASSARAPLEEGGGHKPSQNGFVTVICPGESTASGEAYGFWMHKGQESKLQGSILWVYQSCTILRCAEILFQIMKIDLIQTFLMKNINAKLLFL